MFKKLLFTLAVLGMNLFGAPYTLNFTGDEKKENFTINLQLETDEDGKPVPQQRFDYTGLEKVSSLKIITASGLLGTLKDEREIIAYYKTNLNINGMKIRNLYKVATTRVYSDENNITIKFDKDHYQNIVSFLRYHNIKQDVIKDIDNLYGTWEEIEAQTDISKPQEKIVDEGELK